jgi:hypothetical protein
MRYTNRGVVGHDGQLLALGNDARLQLAHNDGAHVLVAVGDGQAERVVKHANNLGQRIEILDERRAPVAARVKETPQYKKKININKRTSSRGRGPWTGAEDWRR